MIVYLLKLILDSDGYCSLSQEERFLLRELVFITAKQYSKPGLLTKKLIEN
jgi:hypothetical protein